MENIFIFISAHLIELMGLIFIVALGLRYVAFKAGKRDEIYFNTFVKAVERRLYEDEEDKASITNIDSWMHNFLSFVVEELPQRSFRNEHLNTVNNPGVSLRNQASAEPGNKDDEKVVSLRSNFRDYIEGKHSIAIGIKQEMDAFKSHHRPDFYELSSRILEQDKHWRTILGFIPVRTLSRVLDILPGIFIVGGIFGTFIGITSALPMLAEIDLNNLDSSAPILNEFLVSVAYAMYTSIAGIVFSVVMTFLNTLFPVSTVRDAIWRNIERCMEMMWLRVHETQLSHSDQQIINLLGNICEALNGKKKVG